MVQACFTIYFHIWWNAMVNGDSMTLKLLSKIITLADDLVMDVVLHSDTSGIWWGTRDVGSVELDEKLVSALTTTRQWCMLPLQIMDVPSRQIQRKMLETMTNLAPYCWLLMTNKERILLGR